MSEIKQALYGQRDGHCPIPGCPGKVITRWPYQKHWGQCAVCKRTINLNPLDPYQRTRDRLEYLRGEILAERISYGEIAELQSLAKYNEPEDTLLQEWAGVKEKP
jgi:hypothetical protein